MTTDDRNVVRLGSLDRTWILAAFLSAAAAAGTWAWRIDSRMTVQETRFGSVVGSLDKLSQTAESQGRQATENFPRIDQRLDQIERRLDRFDDLVLRVQEHEKGT